MKRSLKGSAVTKYLCNMSVTGLCGLIKSSGRHDDGRCQMGGETSANLPAAWPVRMKPRGSEQRGPLPIKLTGLFLSGYHRCSETRAARPQTPQMHCHSWTAVYVQLMLPFCFRSSVSRENTLLSGLQQHRFLLKPGRWLLTWKKNLVSIIAELQILRCSELRNLMSSKA